MNDRSLDQLLTAWMDLGPTTAPDRVAEAARLEVRTTRQRPAFLSRWATRRFPEMNNMVRVGLVAAAVVAAALLGYSYFIAPNVGGPGPGDPSPTPDPTPSTSAAAAIDFTTHPGEGAELQPGPYVIDYAAPVEVTVTVPDEPYQSWPSPWYKALFDWGPWHQTNNASLGFMDVQDMPVDACDAAAGMQDPAVGPSVADLVEALSAVPYIEVARSDASLDGHSGELLEITGLEVPTDCGEEPVMWVTPQGDVLLIPGTQGRLRVWVLDVEGTRLVVVAAEGEGDTVMSDHLQALIDTIQIEVP